MPHDGHLTEFDTYTHERLKSIFGDFTSAKAAPIPSEVERDLVGEQNRRILTETARIVAHQWHNAIRRSALKGFLFHGGVGVGKTTMAKRIAFEMCRVFGDDGSPGSESEINLILIDGSDIARGRYGDSEERIRQIFDHARTGPVNARGFSRGGKVHRTIVLFDDVESLFLTRNSQSAKEWHMSQNSVFFHNIDELDTAQTVVILTTNRIDLLDDAIVDRFRPYEFPPPSAEVLTRVARSRSAEQQLTADELAPILAAAQTAGRLKSIRELERMIDLAYIEKAIRTEDPSRPAEPTGTGQRAGRGNG
jgi:SpoVK/Ycf46/Vps4 family AAA+-type ATPase